jgi:hypothetical protein
MPSCRSSGVLTASGLVYSGKCKLISIHAQYTGSSATTIKVFDNTAASGKELARLILTANPKTIEFDMHGVLCSKGLFLEISGNAGFGAAVSVEFA